MKNELDKVNIRPGVSVLSVLRYLNYRSWFALAEFVDNSLQSFLANKTQLEKVHGTNFKLKISIDIDTAKPARIVIRDNACGIAKADFPRAFRAAAVPNDRSGLSEFGMGMKSASCWFAPRWQVRTKALGEKVERIIKFDVNHIVNDQIEELDVLEKSTNSDEHYTEVILEDLYHLPVKKTVSKIKEHLTDIYREFIRQGILDLQFNGDSLSFQEAKILRAPYVKDPEGPSRLWRKEITFDLGEGMKVTGFAALRDPGNFARAGFALFRRNRLIQGSGDEGYRPSLVFGQPGSFRSLRLFGELHLEGFEVSHTKDGFRWDENEQPFLQLLKEHLDDNDLPLLKQADNYRALAAKTERVTAAKAAADRTAASLQQKLEKVLPEVAESDPFKTPENKLPKQASLVTRDVEIKFREQIWTIRIELADDPAESQWLAISDSPDGTQRLIEIRLSMVHPFMITFAQTNSENVEALLRVAAALALAETLARRAGVTYAGTVRRNLNEILRNALSSIAI